MDFVHDPFFERVAVYLSLLPVGVPFDIKKKVREENRAKFIECFKYFAGTTTTGIYWWDWDDERLLITKYEKYHEDIQQRQGKNTRRG